MPPVIIEGRFADIDGARPGQIAIENGVITAVAANLGRPDHVFGDSCLIFAGMGDIPIPARADSGCPRNPGYGSASTVFRHASI